MPPRSSTAASAAADKVKLVSTDRVRKEGLLVINNKVYDARAYLSDHPGGTVLATYCGQE